MDSNQPGAVGGIIWGPFPGSWAHLGASRGAMIYLANCKFINVTNTSTGFATHSICLVFVADLTKFILKISCLFCACKRKHFQGCNEQLWSPSNSTQPKDLSTSKVSANDKTYSQSNGMVINWWLPKCLHLFHLFSLDHHIPFICHRHHRHVCVKKNCPV